jgi:Tfp pilus assembly protein PilF
MTLKARAKPRPSPAELAAHAVLQRAVALHRGGMVAQAGELYRQMLDIQPRHFDALHLLGVVRHQQGRNAEALELIGAALAIEPRNASALANQALVLSELGRHAEAIAAYDRALVIEPRNAATLSNRATSLKELGRHADALASCDRALAIQPDSADAVNNRGMVLHALERFDEAVACFDKALALEPAHARGHNNRGAALHPLNRFDEAVASFDRAIALRPADANAFYNRGRSLKEMRRLDEAIASFRRAIAIDPNYTAAHWDEALLLLLRGDFAAGWPAYEWRFKDKEVGLPPRDFAQPQWRGDAPLHGRTILLHAEQGFGDTIQFVRYAPMVAARGAKVVLEVQRPLHALLDGMAGVSTTVCRGDALPEFDLHCPLPSLPLAFATTLDSMPAQVPYLSAPAERIAAWQARLPSGAPRVGLAWSGNPRHKNDRDRSVAFASLAPLIAGSGMNFVSLQKDPRETDTHALRQCANVVHVAAELHDFADTAAVISLLDLVITVDTSVAHLAGALGKPVWILLPTTVDWRWLLDREDSPWYPTARLFRQIRIGDWGAVIARVGVELGGRSPEVMPAVSAAIPPEPSGRPWSFAR